jgi:hypothetical protein
MVTGSIPHSSYRHYAELRKIQEMKSISHLDCRLESAPFDEIIQAAISGRKRGTQRIRSQEKI